MGCGCAFFFLCCYEKINNNNNNKRTSHVGYRSHSCCPLSNCDSVHFIHCGYVESSLSSSFEHLVRERGEQIKSYLKVFFFFLRFFFILGGEQGRRVKNVFLRKWQSKMAIKVSVFFLRKSVVFFF